MEMKRLIIICEGQTEQEFCKDVLYSYFLDLGIILSTTLPRKSHGGIVRWQALKYQIEKHLLQDPTVRVTTFIDLYALPTDYPNFDITNIDDMEKGMHNSVDTKLANRFIPYIQRHEFEGILFCDVKVFKNNFEVLECDFVEIENIINTHPNPENINTGRSTAPSKRLEKNIKGYDKIVYGACLASEIGLTTIRQKCPRFNNWLIELENIVNGTKTIPTTST